MSALLSPAARRYVLPIGAAIGYVGLNKPDSAFRWLEQAYEERAGLDILKTVVAFDTLHADPRWSRLLGRIGLQP